MGPAQDGGGFSRREMLLAAGGVAAATALGGATTAGAAGAAPRATTGPAPADAVYGGLRLGFVLSHEQFRTQRLVELGRRAEQRGFSHVWMSDHAQPWQADEGHAMFPWLTAALVGQGTSRLTFGTAVTTPIFRHHPSEVAQAFASLGVLSPGRVFLGVGTGEAVNEKAMTGGWAPYQERHDRLIEAIALIRQLWTGEIVTFQGRYFQTAEARLWDLPEQPVPLLVAASGPNSATLAGQYGDGWICSAQDIVKPELQTAFAAGAAASGRDPATMPKFIEHFVFVGDRGPAAQRAAQRWLFTLDAWGKPVQTANPQTIQAVAASLGTPDQLLDRWVVSRDPAVHAQALLALRQQGATHVFIHSGQDDQETVVDFFARRVFPLLG
jgi:TAT-translocated FGD2 family F420-dependent dehydrogenase